MPWCFQRWMRAYTTSSFTLISHWFIKLSDAQIRDISLLMLCWQFLQPHMHIFIGVKCWHSTKKPLVTGTPTSGYDVFTVKRICPTKTRPFTSNSFVFGAKPWKLNGGRKKMITWYSSMSLILYAGASLIVFHGFHQTSLAQNLLEWIILFPKTGGTCACEMHVQAQIHSLQKNTWSEQQHV